MNEGLRCAATNAKDTEAIRMCIAVLHETLRKSVVCLWQMVFVVGELALIQRGKSVRAVPFKLGESSYLQNPISVKEVRLHRIRHPLRTSCRNVFRRVTLSFY
jgi:hypothetical protein